MHLTERGYDDTSCAVAAAKEAAGAPELLSGDSEMVSPCLTKTMQKLALIESANLLRLLKTDVLVSVFNKEFGTIYKVPISERLLEE